MIRRWAQAVIGAVRIGWQSLRPRTLPSLERLGSPFKELSKNHETLAQDLDGCGVTIILHLKVTLLAGCGNQSGARRNFDWYPSLYLRRCFDATEYDAPYEQALYSSTGAIFEPTHKAQIGGGASKNIVRSGSCFGKSLYCKTCKLTPSLKQPYSKAAPPTYSGIPNTGTCA